MRTHDAQIEGHRATIEFPLFKALTVYELPPLQTPLWTPDQAIAFEAARECITHMMAIQTAKIYEEEAKPDPDVKRIAELEAAMTALHNERTELRVLDDARIAHVRAHYGAIIRAEMAKEEAKIIA